MKLFLILFICCLFSQQLLAKKLYKYKDQQGHWHYSDKPPETKQEVEVRQMKAGRKRYIWLEKTGDKHHPRYFAINNYHGPVEIEAVLKKANNAQTKPALPKQFIVEPGQSEALFEVGAINEYRSWGYSLQYRYNIGSPLAVHDQQAVYLPPFAMHSQFQITQSFGGQFSHTGEQSQYAVDIAMPVDTPVHAARSGVVIEVNNDFFKNGLTQAYKSRANSVRILHEDGSMAIYAHLALEKAEVYPGMQVSAGQLIGYSGNTGYSTGPHLHFAVQLNQGMKLVSVPFKFSSAGDVSEPIAGKWLERN